MKVTKDTLTTAMGALTGAALAAEPVINMMPAGGSLHQADYFKLAMALFAFVWGWATNKKG